jgi:hypothetical protein
MEPRKKKKTYKKKLVRVVFKPGVGPEEARTLTTKYYQLKIKEDCGMVDEKVVLIIEVAASREQKWVDKFPRIKKRPIVESAERIPVVNDE